MTKQLIEGRLESISGLISRTLAELDTFQKIMSNSIYSSEEQLRQKQAKLEAFQVKVKGMAESTLQDVIAFDLAVSKREANERLPYRFPESQAEGYAAKTAYYSEAAFFTEQLKTYSAQKIEEVYADAIYLGDTEKVRMIEEFVLGLSEHDEQGDVLPLRGKIRQSRDSRVSQATQQDIEFLKSLVSVRRILENIVRNEKPSELDLASLARSSVAQIRPLFMAKDYAPAKVKGK